MAVELTTPDHASHAWNPVAHVEFRSPFVRVAWSDGTSIECFSLWLYENTVGIDEVTRECTVEPGDLPPPDVLVAAAARPDGAVTLTWDDGSTSTVHPGWLWQVATGGHRPEAAIGPPIAWDTTLLPEPPTFGGADVLDDDVMLEAWLSAAATYGLARLRDTPADRGFLERIVERIGPIRGSNFGRVFTVEAKVHPDSTANTGLSLGQHADLPTRETPPGFQFLHCIENSVAGGASRMTDGLTVAAELMRTSPDAYDALTTLQWVFANRALDGDHRWIGPIIDLGAPGEHGVPLTMRAFSPVRLAPCMADVDVPRAYEALRVFSAVAHHPRLMQRTRFEPGDLVVFDNRRILHGRDAFDPGAGTRVLTGCYMDRDDLLSRLRVLRRPRAGVVDADAQTTRRLATA